MLQKARHEIVEKDYLIFSEAGRQRLRVVSKSAESICLETCVPEHLKAITILSIDAFDKADYKVDK